MSESKTHKVTLIPGDGIGPEVTQAVVRILEATGVKWEWERFAAGAEAFEIFGEYIPADLSDSIARNKVALKGPVTTPIGGGFKSINVTLRKQFDLFANFRPIKNLPGLESKWPGVDLIIVRENYRGRIRRSRARSRSRRSRKHQGHHRKRLHAHRQVRL
jgi:isocitrate dehydrogenase (NAD+)